LSKAKERSVSDEDSYDNFSDNSDKDITQGVYITKSEDDKELLRRSPLSKTLLTKIPGVKSLYLGGDFISVTKTPAVQWDIIKPLIFESIMDYYADTSPGEFKVSLVYGYTNNEKILMRRVSYLTFFSVLLNCHDSKYSKIAIQLLFPIPPFSTPIVRWLL